MLTAAVTNELLSCSNQRDGSIHTTTTVIAVVEYQVWQVGKDNMNSLGYPTTSSAPTTESLGNNGYNEELASPSTADSAFMVEYGDYEDETRKRTVYFGGRLCYWYRLLQLLAAAAFVGSVLFGLHCGFADLCSFDDPEPVEFPPAMFPLLQPTASPSMRPTEPMSATSDINTTQVP